MVSGPDVARIIAEFEEVHATITYTKCVQKLAKDDRPLVGIIGELGRPFDDENRDLIIVDIKEIAGADVVETAKIPEKTGRYQFDAFTKECLIEGPSQCMIL